MAVRESNTKTLVVIPTFNAAKFLHRSIKSCINQSKQPEVWIVDNCSTDETVTIVAEYASNYPNIKLMRGTRNLGRIGNWNKCIDLFEESEFALLKFLFMGDELLPQCIEILDRIWEENHDKSLVVISWPYFFKNLEKRETLSPREFEVSRLFSKEDLLKAGFFPGDFLGAIISNAFTKLGVRNNRFDDYLIGIVPFYDRLIVKGNAYFYRDPLSRFNLDSHRTFHHALNWDMSLESSFAKARSLEVNTSWISDEDYQRIKKRILVQLTKDLIRHFSYAFWLKHVLFTLTHSTFFCFKTLKQMILRAIRKFSVAIRRNCVGHDQPL